MEKKMNYRYSTKSKKQLSTCHIDIQKVFDLVIKRSVVDLSIVYGLRTLKEQQKLYACGRTIQGQKVTGCDGIKKKSKHQAGVNGLSNAIDISIYCSDNKFSSATRYDPLHLAYIAGLVDSIAEELLRKKEITHSFRWGGNWDRDGVISYDQRLLDFCHWEIR
jgi:peptidoglycan L-alanyl-D-glutamate endopeptidase CwlK